MRSKQYSPCFEVGLETPFAFRIVQGDCVCVCVRERERERERETDRQTERERAVVTERWRDMHQWFVHNSILHCCIFLIPNPSA